MSDTINPNKPSVLLLYGMGVHSSAEAVELIENESARDFALDQLILISAQTGEEHKETGELVTSYILPILRRHNIRYVQVARAGEHERDGITVLSDTRQPTEVFIEGDYRLGTSMISSGVVPTVCGARACSLKFKKWATERWIKEHLSTPVSKKIIGFHAGENERVERELNLYAEGDTPIEHNLRKWGWDDERCLNYLHARFDVWWKKSCCSFCMFANGKPEAIARLRKDPEAGARAIVIERTARSINPRMTLYSRKSVEALIAADGNLESIRRADEQLEAGGWKLMRVRRIRYGMRNAHRSVETLAQGSRMSMRRLLSAEARRRKIVLIFEGDHPRLYLMRMPDPLIFPAAEEMLTIAPASIKDKERVNFNRRWHEVVAQGNFFHHPVARGSVTEEESYA